MRATCRNTDCGKSFTAIRAGARYCSGRCRMAVHRKRSEPVPAPVWDDGKLRRATTDELSKHLLEIADRDDDGAPKTGRRYYYLALLATATSDRHHDRHARVGKEVARSAYKTPSPSKLGALRMAGRLGWDMVLDLTRELDEWQTYDSPREARAVMRRRYEEDSSLEQHHYPILIVEKDTLEPVCKPIARRWQMPFASAAATPRSSSSMMWPKCSSPPCQDRAVRHHLFRTDLDPTGLDLQRAWQDALEKFGVPHHRMRAHWTDAGAGSGPGAGHRPPRHRGEAFRQPCQGVRRRVRRPMLGG